MDSIKIKTHLLVTTRLFTALWNKESTLNDWRKKHAELHRLAQLLAWEKVNQDALDKALKAYDELYDILKQREDWFQSTSAEYSITWRWLTNRVFEGIRDTDFVKLEEAQKTVSETMMMDALSYISRRHQIWEEPIPEDLQIYALTKHPRILLELKDIINPELAATHRPALWSLIQSLDTLYETTDELTKSKIIDDWFEQQATYGTAIMENKAGQLPFDVMVN